MEQSVERGRDDRWKALRQTPAVKGLLAVWYALAGALAATAVWLLPARERFDGGSRLACALLLALLAGAALGLLFARCRRGAEPSNLLLLGAALWSAGLLPLRRDGLRLAAGLLLAGFGVCVCVTAARRLMPLMENVLRFLGAQGEATRARATAMLCASVAASLSLAVRLLGCSAAPAAACWVAAVAVCALRVPLDNRYARKLERLLALEARGEAAKPLRGQLEGVILQSHRRPWLVRLIMLTLRATYRHRVMGAGNVRRDPDNPVVFLCNHGEIYGPVAAMLYVPGFVRPWVMSEMMGSAEEAAAYVHRYTFGPAKWMPGCLKWPVSRLLGRVSCWGMRQLEAIPVYRNHPHQLVSTFRQAADALQCGDAMVIFPENPNAGGEGHGYENGGVGELFSGFTMLAPVAYRRSGRPCRFVPMYASRRTRSVRFGREITYDPANDPKAERGRLVGEITAEMNRLWREAEA